MSRSSRTAEQPVATIREELLEVRFALEARIARGSMTVRQLLDLRPGSILRSESQPGERVRLCAGPVTVASADPAAEEGNLVLRVDALGPDGA